MISNFLSNNQISNYDIYNHGSQLLKESNNYLENHHLYMWNINSIHGLLLNMSFAIMDTCNLSEMIKHFLIATNTCN